MPRATKTNGNGHKQPKIEDFEMVSPAPTAEHEAITLPEEITWEEALKLTGCPSRALLVLRLAPMLPDVDVDGLVAIPLAFKSQLEEIKAQIVAEEAVKKLGASISQKSPLPLLEAPVSDSTIVSDDPVHITSNPAKKPSKSRLSKQETADIRKQNAELTVAKIKETAKARKQRLARQEGERTEKLQQIQEVSALEAIEEILVAAEAREEILTAIGDKQSDEDNAHYEQKITAANERLSQIGSKLRIAKAEDIKQQKEDFVARNQEHQDFFTTLADAWSDTDDEKTEEV